MSSIMEKTYRPRRAGKRWLEEAPEYVLDVFDFKHTWVVLFGGSLLDSALLKDRRVHCLEVNALPTSPNMGVSLWGEWQTYIRPSHRRIRWLDLPEEVRAHVISRATKE